MQGFNNFLQQGQEIVYVTLFIEILLSVLLIYVGICIIQIKNDVKELTDLEFKKYKETRPNDKKQENELSNGDGASTL
ncbi:hypothetical protein IKD49_02875 [Candidatus Saccharibacteria bacterium]|nr:hypothetical protein [Candidatus Saccharibacteria bacterium]MBR2754004.1 hypothetical protein [Candidatus Saccharibacteria bacterium]